MASIQEIRDAIKSVTDATGDPKAWMSGLSSADVDTVVTPISTPAQLDFVLTKIRANHPTVFAPIPVPSAPAVPPPDNPHGEQRGAAATALKKAEADLAQQNSTTAKLDLLVISAVLNAHTTSQQGAETLARLQLDIENAVRTRTDLDTPAGARDFQRYLIGKLRQIAGVVETASLDDTSKAGLAAAWSALYESTRRVESENRVAATERPASTSAAAGPPPMSEQLPPYGLEFADPLTADTLPAAGMTAPMAAQQPGPVAPAPVPQVAPAIPPLPSLPTGGGLATPAALPLPRMDDGLEPTPADRREMSGLDDLLAELDSVPPGDDEEPDDDQRSDDDQQPDEDVEKPAQEPVAEPPSTSVRLPDGDVVNAPTPQIANAIRAVLDGTPLSEAFHKQGIAVPPPGTAVPHPVPPTDLVTGDIGMFTDRQALALDAKRALLNGQIQPVTGVSGPSFLGWLHPPGPGQAAPSLTSPTGEAVPPPTRPANVAAHAR